MAVETGTSSGYLDLMAKLKTFLSGLATNPWTCLKDADGELIMQGPGLADTEEIIVGIKAYYSVGDDYYNWELQGFTGYDAGLTWDEQPGSIPVGTQMDTPRLCLWNSNMTYWFVANARRVIIIAKVSTVYQAAYLGFIRPYATPGQYPYPLAIGGSSNIQSGERWSVQSATNVGAFPDPVGSYEGMSTLRLRSTAGTWLGIRNNSGTYYTWPYAAAAMSAVYAKPSTLREGVDGSYPLMPVIIHSSSPTNCYGELEGVYYVSGFNNAAENIVEDDDDAQYLVVQNVYLTTVGKYFAIKLE